MMKKHITQRSKDIIYLVDNCDKICSVNKEYEEFADENVGIKVVSKSVLNSSLWNFVTDPTTRELYRSALGLVRNGRIIKFKFRCDSPNCRRLMEMQMRCIKNGRVEFRVRTISKKNRPSQALWDPLSIRSNTLLHVCSWCKKIQVGDEWVEVEDAVKRLRLFERPAMPSVSHGICGQCLKETTDILEAS